MRGGGKNRVGILLILIFAIGLVCGFFWLGKSLLFGEKSVSQKSAHELNAGEKILKNREKNSNFGLRISARGPIVAPENHYSFALTIFQDSRNLTIWRGYDGKIFKQINKENSRKSFADFAAAAQVSGMAREKNGEFEKNLAGICASGQLIRFEIIEKNSAKFSLWTTSCSGILGNFGGDSRSLVELFLKQIPGAKKEIDAAKNAIEK